MAENLLSQGAEAVIILENANQVIKNRIKKSYRIREIDEKIRKLRTRSEGKILEKAGKIIAVPRVLKSDEKERKIFMEFIDGKRLSEKLSGFSEEKQKEIMGIAGENTAKLHDAGIIHGDLTTSNMIYVKKNNNFKIYFIDFGLAFHSQKAEDKAVDLHLLKEALEAKHFQNWQELFNSFKAAYSKISSKEKEVFERLKKVEQRGRYKH